MFFPFSQDDESENLVSVEEPQSPSTTNADLLSLITSLAHRAMLLSDIKVEDEDQGKTKGFYLFCGRAGCFWCSQMTICNNQTLLELVEV